MTSKIQSGDLYSLYRPIRKGGSASKFGQTYRPLIFKDLTHKIIGAALEVYKILGYGFIEDVYEKALLKEFELRGIPAKCNCNIDVSYKGDTIPCYLPNILVDGKVIVDLRAEEEYTSGNEPQIINFLKATGIKVGLIINFGRKGCTPRRLCHDKSTSEHSEGEERDPYPLGPGFSL